MLLVKLMLLSDGNKVKGDLILQSAELRHQLDTVQKQIQEVTEQREEALAVEQTARQDLQTQASVSEQVGTTVPLEFIL